MLGTVTRLARVALATGLLAMGFLASPLLSADAGAQGVGQGQRATLQPRAPEVEVVLLRGLFNIFSLGMDELAAKFGPGITAEVSNHTSWSAIAEELIERVRAKRGPRRLVLVGHSLGGNDIFALAARLGEAGVTVDLMVPIDPTNPALPTPNVRRVVNYFQSNNGWGAPVANGPRRGQVVNADLATNRRDLAHPDVGHVSIDKSDRLHREIVTMVRDLARRR